MYGLIATAIDDISWIVEDTLKYFSPFVARCQGKQYITIRLEPCIARFHPVLPDSTGGSGKLGFDFESTNSSMV